VLAFSSQHPLPPSPHHKTLQQCFLAKNRSPR
jgi:hypothetical protein